MLSKKKQLSHMLCINQKRKKWEYDPFTREGDSQRLDNRYNSSIPRHMLAKEGDPQAWHDPSIRKVTPISPSPIREPQDGNGHGMSSLPSK